ncbi:MAG: MurR/RpiR family transcriptional regulator [Coprobacillus sp.]
MSLLNKLELTENFSSSEKSIANFILKYGNDVLNMSSVDLAHATFTSPATITRLSQKLGYKGYNEMKIDLSAQLQYTYMKESEVNPNFPFHEKQTIHEIAHNISKLAKDSVDHTLSHIEINTFTTVIRLLDKAECIDIYAVSNPLRLASDFQYKMFRIGKCVQIAPMVNEQLFQAAQSQKNHCAILISYSGETDEVNAAAQILKNKNTPTIAITSFGDNQLSRLCDYVLHVDSRERIYAKISTFGSSFSIYLLLDIIYSCIFSRNYQESLNFKLNTDRVIDHRQEKKK